MRNYGVMLDCSRNGVMKVEQVKRMIDYLCKIGFNILELYTEDTYEIDGEPYFGYMRGRYTGEEIREIDAYAKLHGVELVPCIQTLAHFTNLVRHEAYYGITDVNDILLIDEPETYRLIDKMFLTVANNFSSRRINIGMDEAHLMGLGRYLDKHGYRNRFDLFLKHLNKVVEIADKYGFKVHMWGDMFLRLANNGNPYGGNISVPQSVVDKIPKNVELIYWDYYHYEKKDYDEMFDIYKKLNQPVWFCGSLWTCGSFVPIWNKVLETMKPAMQSVLHNDVRTVLLTAWGDGGHECSYFAAIPLLYVLKEFADGNFDYEKIEGDFYDKFNLRLSDFELLSKTNGYDGKLLFTNTMHLYNDCLLGLNDDFVVKNGAVPYKRLTSQLKKAADSAGEFKYIFEFASALSYVLELKYDFGVRLRSDYKKHNKSLLRPYTDECEEIIRRVDEFYKTYKALWFKENKPFGFEVQTARIGALKQRMTDCKERLLDYISGRVDKIDELEETPLPRCENNMQYSTLFTAGSI